jgi:hypothetical protein
MTKDNHLTASNIQKSSVNKKLNAVAVEKAEEMAHIVSELKESVSPNNAKTDQQELLDAIQRLQTMVDELSAHFATRH